MAVPEATETAAAAEDEEEGIRIFSWTARGAPVVDAAPPPQPTRAPRWRPGDSDDEEEEWRRRAVDMAVDGADVQARAPMLQEEFQRLERERQRESKVSQCGPVHAHTPKTKTAQVVAGDGLAKKRKMGKKERLKARALALPALLADSPQSIHPQPLP
mmetsp:Transcript_16364/g.26353  ORF Transcript_16364/g.26353 Transcript_16364/m.26353 type:complete len:158 (-) Transcript_16364:503-976(-)